MVFALAILFSVSVVSKGFVGQRMTDDLFSVSFGSEKHGWAVGRWGSVLHTADGGKTWKKQDSGVTCTLSSVSFVDENNGWAVGDQGTILHTADGGKTWGKQKCPVTYFLMGTVFVTRDKGWIVTERTNILHTEDGGKTWAVQFKDQDFILKSVSFCDERNGWAVGEYGYVYHTADGGRTWKHQAGEFGFSEETGEVVGGNYLFDVAAVNPKTAWIVGIDGYVAKTVDAGKTWRKQMTGVPKTHLFGVCVGEKGVLIAGDAVLLRTTDGGATWRDVKVEPSIRYGWLYRIGTRGKEGFVAVGFAGWIYGADAGAGEWRRAETR